MATKTSNPIIPTWSPSGGDYIIRPNPARFDGTSVYLTDARRVGIMLRDRRLTLRNHAALTRFVVELDSDAAFILHTPNCDGDNYVRVGNKGAFYANSNKKDAQRFEFRPTVIGLELWLGGQRPAVFDDFYDVSIGKWKDNSSPIPILVHSDSNAIWPSQWAGPGGSANPGGGFAGLGTFGGGGSP